MAKLVERLKDPARSGVYRTTQAHAVLEVLKAGAIDLARIQVHGRPLFEALAEALAFPDWFGYNWDALEDCLSDLSWRQGPGHVLLFEDYPKGDELGVLIEVLRSSAQYWASRGQPFFALFVDPQRRLTLPDLYREG
jgi:Barstar (barnase inhibitor)